MIEFHDIRKAYAGRAALDGASLRLPPRQTHVLLGSSGSGKSTLLRILLGLEAPDSGFVEIDGVRMEPGNRDRLKRIGYVPQEGGLFPHMTVAENASLVARRRGWAKPKIEARLDELRHVVGLPEDLLKLYPRQLSGGQSQRVSILRAAFLDPQAMVLDEPLGALDPIIRNDLQDELKSIFTRLKKTVVFVTHDLGEAAFFGDTITLLHDGRVVQTGRIRDFVQRPASEFVSRFIRAQRTFDDLGTETRS